MRLVEKVRRMRNWYHKVDAKAFSPDGHTARKTRFGHTGEVGNSVRALELRECKGGCGYADHHFCLKSKRPNEEVWPDDQPKQCWCGCDGEREVDVELRP
eukprot:2088380-Rhodomonas_salina.1